MRTFLRQLVCCIRAAARFAGVEIAGRLLYYSGLLFFIGAIRQRFGPRRLFIPMYHRVREPGDEPDANLLGVQRGVPIELFERHVRVFQRFGRLLTLGEAYGHMRDSSQPPRTVIAITFDDGYRDNVTLAVPALRRLGVPATLFPVVRTASGGRPFWWDELTDVLARSEVNGGGLLPYLSRLEECEPIGRERVRPGASRAALAGYLCERLVALSRSRRERVIDELSRRLRVRAARNAPQLYAGWNELRAVADAGFEIGGHTVDHPVLSREQPNDAEAQIAGCRATLEHELDQPIRSFAYPNGGNDATIRALVAASGFRVAVTVEHGVNYAATDAHELRRMPISCERPFELALKLAFYGWVHRGR